MRSQTARNIHRLLGYLPRHRLWSLGFQILLSLVPGVVDLLTVAVVARLTGALSGAALDDWLPSIHVFGGDRPDQSLWLIGVFLLLAWISSLTKLLLRFLQNSVSTEIWRDLSDQAFSRVLRQSFEYHLTRSTPELASQILQNYERISAFAIRPILQMISAAFSVSLISIGVLWIGRWSAVALVVSLASAYALITTLITPRFRHATRQRLRQERGSNEILNESLALVRDIQLTGSEAYFESQFERTGRRAKKYVVAAEILPEIPRGLIEPLGITLIFVIGAFPYIISSGAGSLEDILPFLSTMALAALKVTSPLQDLFRGITMLRGSMPIIESALDILELPSSRPTLQSPGVPSPMGVFPRHTIRLNEVNYGYPGNENLILRDLSLTIPVGARVALVGTTGSGKTTTANILLGLLSPSSGTFELDGIPVEDLDLPAWQANCAQVPQSIMLLNRSILENVAFGENFDRILQDRVWECLEAAQLHDFVAGLPYGIYTQIGENGLRLSGGQRQRLALARAFYRKSSFLVLDEATSALDNRTESDLIEAIELIGRRCTTLIIAHRMSTVKRCDKIYYFNDGAVLASGSYEQMLESSPHFRDLVGLESI